MANERLKQGGPIGESEFLRIKSMANEICAEVPFIDGLPFFSASTDTYWSILRYWEGKIPIENEEYIVHVNKSEWYIIGIDKRNIKDTVSLVCTKVWKQWLEVFLREAFIRKSKRRNKADAISKQHWDANKDEINLARRNKRVEVIKANSFLINQIYKWVIEGKDRKEIEILLLEKDNTLTEKKIQHLMAQSRREIKEVIMEERADLKEKHHAQMMDLYQKMVAIGDNRGALDVLVQLNKMYGLNEAVTQKLEIKQQIIKFNFDSPIQDGEIKHTKSINIEAEDVNYQNINEGEYNDILPLPPSHMDDDLELPFTPEPIKIEKDAKKEEN